MSIKRVNDDLLNALDDPDPERLDPDRPALVQSTLIHFEEDGERNSTR